MEQQYKPIIQAIKDGEEKIIERSFGYKNPDDPDNDYTLHQDKERRNRYIMRSKGHLKTGDPTRAGFLSMFLLWNKKTLKALQGSIKKWENIVAGTGVDRGTENCPLCQLYINNRCEGCPVKKKTQLIGCLGTPYGAYESSHKDHKKLAQAEVYFLKSLLPKGK